MRKKLVSIESFLHFIIKHPFCFNHFCFIASIILQKECYIFLRFEFVINQYLERININQIKNPHLFNEK